MKNIPDALLNTLGTRQGLVPIVIMRVIWDYDDIVYYTQVPFEISAGMFTTETILSLESINFRGHFDTNTTVSSFNVTLDDSTGSHEERLRTTCYEKKAVSLFIGFLDSTPPGLDTNHNPIGFVESFLGVISGSVTHSSEDQTISLNLETRVEDKIMGFTYPGTNFEMPMCFGDPKRVPVEPVDMGDVVELTQMFDGGNGPMYVNLPDLFPLNTAVKITLVKPDLSMEMDFVVQRYSDDNMIRILGTHGHDENSGTWGKVWKYYEYLYSNMVRGGTPLPCTISTDSYTIVVPKKTMDYVSLGLVGKWVRLGYSLTLDLPTDVPLKTGTTEGGEAIIENFQYSSNYSFFFINKCKSQNGNLFTFEEPFIALNADRSYDGRTDQEVLAPSFLIDWTSSDILTGQWEMTAHCISQPINKKANALYSFKHDKVRWYRTLWNRPNSDYERFNIYSFPPGSKVRIEGIEPRSYFINCDTHYNSRKCTRKVVIYSGSNVLVKDKDYKIVDDDITLDGEVHKYTQLIPLGSSFTSSANAYSAFYADVYSDVGQLTNITDGVTRATDVIKWAINKYRILDDATSKYNEIDIESFNKVSENLTARKIYCNFCITSGKNVLDFIREVAWQSMCAVNFNAGKAYIRFLPDGLIPKYGHFSCSNILFRSIVKAYTPIEDLSTKVIAYWGRNQYNEPNKLIYENTINQKRYGLTTRDIDLYTIDNLNTAKIISDFWGMRYSKPWRLVQLKTDLNGLTIDINDAIQINTPRLSTHILTGTVTNVSIDIEQCEVTIDVQLASNADTVTGGQPSVDPDYWLIDPVLSEDPENPVTPPPPDDTQDTWSIEYIHTFSDGALGSIDFNNSRISYTRELGVAITHVEPEYDAVTNIDAEVSALDMYRIYTGCTVTYTNAGSISKDVSVALSISIDGVIYPQYYGYITINALSTYTSEVGYVIQFNTCAAWECKKIQFIWKMLDKQMNSQFVVLGKIVETSTNPIKPRDVTIKIGFDELINFNPTADFLTLVDYFNLKPVNNDIFKARCKPNVQMSMNPRLVPDYVIRDLNYPDATNIYGVAKKRKKAFYEDGVYVPAYWVEDGVVIYDVQDHWWLPFYTYTEDGPAHLSGWLVYPCTKYGAFNPITSEYTLETITNPYLGTAIIVYYNPDADISTEWDGYTSGTCFLPSNGKSSMHRYEIEFPSVLDMMDLISGFDWYTAGYTGTEGAITWKPGTASEYEYKRISRVCIYIKEPNLMYTGSFIRFAFTNMDYLLLPVFRYSFAMPLIWDDIENAKYLDYDKSGWSDGWSGGTHEYIDVNIDAIVREAIIINRPLYIWIMDSYESTGDVTAERMAYDFVVYNGGVPVQYDTTEIIKYNKYDYDPNPYSKGLWCVNSTSTEIPAFSPVVLLPSKNKNNRFQITTCQADSITPHIVYFTNEVVAPLGDCYIYSTDDGDCKVSLNTDKKTSYINPNYEDKNPFTTVGTAEDEYYLDSLGIGFVVTKLDGDYIWVTRDRVTLVLNQVPNVDYPFLEGVLAYADMDIESNRFVKITNPTMLPVNGSYILGGVSYPGTDLNLPNRKLLVSAFSVKKGEYGLFYTIGIIEYYKTVLAVEWENRSLGWGDNCIVNYTADGMVTRYNVTEDKSRYVVIDVGLGSDGGPIYHNCVKIEPILDSTFVSVSNTTKINDDGLLTIVGNIATATNTILPLRDKNVTVTSDIPFRLSRIEIFSKSVTTNLKSISRIYFDTTNLQRNSTIVLYIDDIKIPVTYTGSKDLLDTDDPSNYTDIRQLSYATADTVYSVPYKVGNKYQRDVVTVSGVRTEYYKDGWQPLEIEPYNSASTIKAQLISQGKPIPTVLL